MCQRLYRPGYSMPELSTPPRRSSTCTQISSRAEGLNGSAVRVTRTPPAVTKSVLSCCSRCAAGSTGAPCLMPGTVRTREATAVARAIASGYARTRTALLAAPPLEAAAGSHEGELSGPDPPPPPRWPADQASGCCRLLKASRTWPSSMTTGLGRGLLVHRGEPD